MLYKPELAQAARSGTNATIKMSFMLDTVGEMFWFWGAAGSQGSFVGRVAASYADRGAPESFVAQRTCYVACTPRLVMTPHAHVT